MLIDVPLFFHEGIRHSAPYSCGIYFQVDSKCPKIRPKISTAQPPLGTPPDDRLPPPQAEIEYQNLRAFFETLIKYTYGAILVVLTLAGGLLWKNISEVKDQASRAIQATQDSATEQIKTAGTNATSVAQSRAQKAIDEALEKPHVQQMIEHSVREKLGTAVEVQVQKDLGPKIDAFRNLVTEIGEISNHGAQLRLGFRPGLDYLLKKMQSPDPTVRAYARSTLTLIGSDYDQRNNQLTGGNANVDPLAMFGAVQQAKSKKGLMGLIHNSDNPNIVAAAFLDIKKLTGWDVQTFEIPAADEWCDSHKPQCDE